MAATGYAKPDVLVDTEWVAQHGNDAAFERRAPAQRHEGEGRAQLM